MHVLASFVLRCASCEDNASLNSSKTVKKNMFVHHTVTTKLPDCSKTKSNIILKAAVIVF